MKHVTVKLFLQSHLAYERVGCVQNGPGATTDTHFVSFVSNTRVVGYDASWLDLFQNTKLLRRSLYRSILL